MSVLAQRIQCQCLILDVLSKLDSLLYLSFIRQMAVIFVKLPQFPVKVI